jgi:hypothetical protein
MNSMLFVRLDLPSSNLRCLGWGPLVHCRTLWCLWFSRGSNHSLLLVGVLTMVEFSNPCHSCHFSISFIELWPKISACCRRPLDAKCLILACIVLGAVMPSPYEIEVMPIRDDGVSQPVPIGALATAVGNAPTWSPETGIVIYWLVLF